MTALHIAEASACLEKFVNEALVNSLNIMLGKQTRAEKSTGMGSVVELTWFRQDFTPEGVGFVDFGLERKAAVSLGRKILVAGGLNQEDDEVALGTVTEVLTQVGAGLAIALASQLKLEVSAKTLSLAQPSARAATAVRVVLHDQEIVSLAVCPSPSLLSVFSEVAAVLTTAVVPMQSTSSNTRNLDLLLDIEMPVSVCFGRAQLPLKDVVKLTSGSIVELNRTVSDPVDIVVNSSVIARGEVVVVEGNFGVRIKEIKSKQERLHSSLT